LSPDRSAELERIAGLARLGAGVDALVVSARGLARKVIPPSTLEEGSERLAPGQSLDRDAFARDLVELGYQNAPLVEDPGAFAVRGAIVDLWPPAAPAPVRIELFGDEIESLRAFDPQNQRTNATLESLSVPPAREVLI